MENAVDAIKMAFAMMVFALALSVSMYAFTVTSSAAQVISYTADESNYYSNLRLDADANYQKKRFVRAETIIPTLYRYYKENFSVKIYSRLNPNNTNEEYDPPALFQLFDVNVEGEVRKAARKKPSEIVLGSKDALLLSLYNNTSERAYLYEAPWIADTKKYTKSRIDLFISGQAAYINDVLVDYSNVNLKVFLDLLNQQSPAEHNPSESVPTYVFSEIFVKYTYNGDTISVGEGEGVETITGSKQTEDKIDIIYTFEKNPEAQH
jgi:hypothetical protein